MQVGALRHGAKNVFMQGGVLGRVPLRRSFPLRFLFSNLHSAGLVDVPSLLFRKLLIFTGVSGGPVGIIASGGSALSLNLYEGQLSGLDQGSPYICVPAVDDCRDWRSNC